MSSQESNGIFDLYRAAYVPLSGTSRAARTAPEHGLDSTAAAARVPGVGTFAAGVFALLALTIILGAAWPGS